MRIYEHMEIFLQNENNEQHTLQKIKWQGNVKNNREKSL